MTMAACYTTYEVSSPVTSRQHQVTSAGSGGVIHKDYSRPLHVDCSVEYELPSQAKPPPGGRNEPLLMIHPCYFRKMESQRRSPFINNLPGRGGTTAAVPTVPQAVTTTSNTTSRRSSSSVSSSAASRVIQTGTIPVSIHHQHQRSNQQNIVQANTARTMQQQQQQSQAHLQQINMPTAVVHQQYSTSTANSVVVPQQYQVSRQHSIQNTNPGTQATQWDPLLAAGATTQCYNTNNKPPVVSVTVGKRDTMLYADGGLWDSNPSPLAAERFPEPQQIMMQHPQHHPHGVNHPQQQQVQEKSTGKYRQYLRAHRLHPYMSMAATAFPQLAQMQQISCYNV